MVACILGRYRNPEFGFRAVLALTRDGRMFGAERLDAACARALIIVGPMGPTRRSVVAILRNKLEKGPLPSEEIASVAVHHENVRGPSYFEKEDKDDCR